MNLWLPGPTNISKYLKSRKVSNQDNLLSGYFGIFFWLNIVKEGKKTWRKEKLSTSVKLNQQSEN